MLKLRDFNTFMKLEDLYGSEKLLLSGYEIALEYLEKKRITLRKLLDPINNKAKRAAFETKQRTLQVLS